MSLESQISALVSAANKLTAEVANKMKGIDQKVDKATESVPTTIREMASQAFYVNSDVGVDASSRNGSSSEPFKTMLYAASRAAPGAQVSILLRGNADHICEVPEDVSHHNHFHGKTFFIAGQSSKWESQNPSRLLCRATVWRNDTSVSRCNYFEGSSLKIAFYQVEIETQNTTGLDAYGGGSTPPSFGGLFTRGTTSGGYLDASLHFLNVNLIMNGDLRLVTGYTGAVGIFTDSFTISGDASVPIPIITRKFALSFRLGNLSAAGFSGSTLPQILGYSAAQSAESIVV